MSQPATALRAVKIIHTVIWAFFAACIIAIPVLTWRGNLVLAAGCVGLVFVEVIVLLFNNWRCPLTPIAARYTSNRHDNFDIFLPEWLARHNKTIFGGLYVAGTAYTAAKWLLG